MFPNELNEAHEETIMDVNRMKAVTRCRRGIPGRATRPTLFALASLGCAALPLPSNAVNPVHPNPTAEQDEATVVNRGDVVNLPAPLKRVLGELAEESHTYLPLRSSRKPISGANCFSIICSPRVLSRIYSPRSFPA